MNLSWFKHLGLSQPVSSTHLYPVHGQWCSGLVWCMCSTALCGVVWCCVCVVRHSVCVVQHDAARCMCGTAWCGVVYVWYSAVYVRYSVVRCGVVYVWYSVVYVWYSVVWCMCGTAWCGAVYVWYSVVRCGVCMWYSVVRCGVVYVWYSVMRCGVVYVWYSVVRRSVCVVQRGAVWCVCVWYSVVRRGVCVVQRGVARCMCGTAWFCVVHVWYSMVRCMCGIAWCGAVWCMCGIAWCGPAWCMCGTAWCGAVWCMSGTAWCGAVYEWYSVVQCGAVYVWYSVVRCGAVWCRLICNPYCECGRLLVHDPGIRQSTVRSPQPLQWDVGDEGHVGQVGHASLGTTIQRALTTLTQRSDDLDLVIVDHDAYGSGFIKGCKVSPDAYILSIQLAYYLASEPPRDRFALTYEASMTRLYLAGRTETVRSLTQHSVDFVRCMVEPGSSKRERVSRLRRAASHHQLLYKDAMNGGGVDRHIFCLYVVCKGLGYESPFLQSILHKPWTLSTSQQPQQQMVSTPSSSLPEFKEKVSPGGGFGPVSDEGYGVSYMIPREDKIFFHISSKKSCAATDSARFARILFESLDQMREIFTGGTESAPESMENAGGGK